MDKLTDITVGTRVPDHVQGPISRGTLALFAGASNDHMLLHIDSDYVKAAGMDDVFAHGMLSMAYLAQMLTHWAPQSRIKRWNIRFAAITPLHATVRCTGEVVEILEEDGEKVARLAIAAAIDDGTRTLEGEAFISLAGEISV